MTLPLAPPRDPGLIVLRLWLTFGRIKIARIAYYINRFAGVAQLVEWPPRKRQVGSSKLPVSSTGVGIPLVLFHYIFLSFVPWLLARQPGTSAGVAQSEERPTYNVGIDDGSSPSIGTRGALLPPKRVIGICNGLLCALPGCSVTGQREVTLNGRGPASAGRSRHPLRNMLTQLDRSSIWPNCQKGGGSSPPARAMGL